MNTKQKPIYQTFIFIFLSTTILFILKALLSSNISMADEMHYIATSLRFCKGDAFLVDDWSPEQLNGFLLMPFIYLFKLIFKSNDGIVLYFRILYIIFKILISVYAIHRLKLSNTINMFSLSSVLFYYFFTPYNIDTLSYNTIPLSMIFLISIIILTSHSSKWDYYLCGILLAFAVLSQPFIIILYFVGSFACCGYSLYILLTKKNTVSILFFKNYLVLTAGACTIALIFLSVILSRATVNEILQNIPYIFSEPDHDVSSSNIFVTLGEKLQTIFHSFWNYCHGRITYINLLCLVIIVVGKFKKNLIIPYTVSVICLLLSCAMVFTSHNAFLMNAIYIPFVWFCIEQFLISNAKKTSQFIILVLCCIYTVCTALGTNTGILSTSAAMCSFAILSLIIASEIVSTIHSYKLVKSINFVILLTILISTLIMRLCIVWTDLFKPKDYTCYFNNGPLKGTFASEALYNQYLAIIEDLDSIYYIDQNILFCGTPTPTAYLYADWEFGTMGTPFFYLDYTRLETYFSLHPNKLPTIIYYEELSGSEEERNFLDAISRTYQIVENTNGLLAIKNS